MTSAVRFVAYSRRGIGASTAGTPAGSRRVVTTTVIARAARDGHPEETQPARSAPLAVLGPADVIGIDPAQVVRRSPLPDDSKLEPNYLAAIEFAHPDLPWMFTATPPVGPQRALPWLMLLVVQEDPGHSRLTSLPDNPNPVLALLDALEVPSPDDAWAWAHVQVHQQDQSGGTQAARDLLASDNPQAAEVRSRLLCPTHLAPDSRYLACVVPVFEAGRRVGLGQDEGDAGVATWAPSPGLQLPVYDSWRFGTGPEGDFETLARRLSPTNSDLLNRLGFRTVAIEARASLMQADDGQPELYAPTIRQVPTAISSPRPDTSFAPDSHDPQAAPLHERLKEVVDLVAQQAAATPIVGPPLYGQWHAGVTSLDGAPQEAALEVAPADTKQIWVEQLNADPYQRIAAGLGVRIVQHDQESLMAQAWDQLADLRAANRRIGWARMFASANTVVHRRLAAARPAAALRLAAPALGRLRSTTPTSTLHATLEGSTLPSGLISAAYLKAARFASRATQGSATPTGVVQVVANTVDAVVAKDPGVTPDRFHASGIIDSTVLGGLLDDAVVGGYATSVPAQLDAIEAPPITAAGAGFASQAVDGLLPEAAYERLLTYAHQDFGEIVRQRSPFHPAAASPVFSQPLIERLATIDEEWVLGGVGALPTNSICVLAANQVFTEAFLVGANHEMGRELLWRGFPSDLRGSCFLQFWPGAQAEALPLDRWSGPLGQHGVSGSTAELTVVVIKGDLLRRYPSTIVSAERGSFSVDGTFVSDNDGVAHEVFRGVIGQDVSYVALDIDPREVDETPGHSWYISLLEPFDEPRLGLDDDPTAAAGSNRDPVSPTGEQTGQVDPAVADSWSWQGLGVPSARHLTPDLVFAHDSSAVVGASLYQVPFRLLLKARDFMPPG
jgi:hypothetical protein